MKKILSIASLIILSVVFSGITNASQTTGTLQVSANVVSVCTVTTSPVNFGNVTESSIANGDVTVNCPSGTAYHIALDAGQHLLGWRRVVLGPYSVKYELDKIQGGPEWGDNDPGYANTYSYGSSVADTGNGANQAHTVYAYLLPFTGIPAGTTLTDTVTVTVYY